MTADIAKAMRLRLFDINRLGSLGRSYQCYLRLAYFDIIRNSDIKVFYYIGVCGTSEFEAWQRVTMFRRWLLHVMIFVGLASAFKPLVDQLEKLLEKKCYDCRENATLAGVADEDNVASSKLADHQTEALCQAANTCRLIIVYVLFVKLSQGHQ